MTHNKQITELDSIANLFPLTIVNNKGEVIIHNAQEIPRDLLEAFQVQNSNQPSTHVVKHKKR